MNKLVFIILFALGISGTTIARHRKRHAASQEHRQLGEHVRLLRRFPCKEPQLRVIPVRDLIEHRDSDAEFTPAATVLARCDAHTGTTCSLTDVCGPKTTEPVQLYFVVNYVSDKSRKKHYMIIPAVNHTECHCIPKASVVVDSSISCK